MIVEIHQSQLSEILIDLCYQCYQSIKMPQLLVRNVDPSIVKKLKSRALAKGISMEEEHRRLLKEYVFQPTKDKPSLMEFLLQGDGVDVELEIERSQELENRDIGL